MAKFDYYDAYDTYRYAVFGQKPKQKFRNEPVEISCELQCDANYI